MRFLTKLVLFTWVLFPAMGQLAHHYDLIVHFFLLKEQVLESAGLRVYLFCGCIQQKICIKNLICYEFNNTFSLLNGFFHVGF